MGCCGVPPHAGLLEALVQDGLVAALDGPASYKVALLYIINIVYMVSVVAYIPGEIDGALCGFINFLQHFQNNWPFAVFQLSANVGSSWPEQRLFHPKAILAKVLTFSHK